MRVGTSSDAVKLTGIKVQALEEYSNFGLTNKQYIITKH